MSDNKQTRDLLWFLKCIIYWHGLEIQIPRLLGAYLTSVSYFTFLHLRIFPIVRHYHDCIVCARLHNNEDRKKRHKLSPLRPASNFRLHSHLCRVFSTSSFKTSFYVFVDKVAPSCKRSLATQIGSNRVLNSIFRGLVTKFVMRSRGNDFLTDLPSAVD